MSHELLEKDFFQDQDLLPIEQRILFQYQQVAIKVAAISEELAKINRAVTDLNSVGPSGHAEALRINLRGLERKIGLIYTLFRTAVYSMVLENELKESTGSDGEF